ncbi:hypothetical protein ACIQXI_10545 [Lysinibacillus sp. NPDC097195]|uniref:hypothetical protein n=1 Tax=Lysinibacillus sp. NPDC097195 TaxID=3364141 RepID=UPI00382C45BA
MTYYQFDLSKSSWKNIYGFTQNKYWNREAFDVKLAFLEASDSAIEIQVNVRDIEQMDELIEVGYDEETNRKFYKIYFNEEV